jgi:NAD(P)-dependent dehydrogenase (short-subunit alcohol dehydrogenase family)
LASKPSPTSASGSKNPLKGKIALVTGATQGIGLAIARALADEGCTLVLCGRNRSRLRTVEAQLTRKKVRVLAVACDVRDEQSVAQLFAAIRKQFRRLDILVNSAGIAHAFIPVNKLPAEKWNDVLATNLTGMFLVTQAALPLMKRGATIANVLSISSKRAFPNLAAYNASKFGALGFTRTLRGELRSEGIRVIALLPGATDTPIWDTLWPDAPREKMIHPATVAQALVSALKLPQESTVEELDIMPTAGAL